MRFRIGRWAQFRKLDVPVLALMLVFVRRPCLEHDFFRFEETFLSFVWIDVEALVIVNVVGGATA